MTSSVRHAFAPFSNGGSNPLYLDGKDQNENCKSERSELIDLFQTYADMYPNPRLVEEYRLRDTLLQAASAARVASGKENKQPQKPRGFFTRWIFGDNDGPKMGEDLNTSKDNATAMSEDPLVYLDADHDPDDEILCGTMNDLDLDCIPTEIYSLARFHLTSTRTRHDGANVFREGVVFSSSTLSLVVVGLGEIAELSTQQEPCLSKTSDRDMLLEYAETRENFVLSYVRATIITDNCIAVSWGFLDGIITIYRRVKRVASSPRWEAVWILGPSSGVLENMRGREFFHDDEDHPGSPLLRVSDCLPLHMETGQESEPDVVTVAVARLGGYIELIPLPNGIWNGPCLEQDTKAAHKSGSRSARTHYTSGRSIQSPPNTLALTTAQCHIDVLSLQALRTSVDVDSTWDVDAFPDFPPSEYIICASGMNENGLEVISFWATSIGFSEAKDRRPGIVTELHSSLIEAITTETGADISVFATPGIIKRWRKPRSVAIRENFNLANDPDGASKIHLTFQERVTTISITSPIVKLEQMVQQGTWLTAMDWNGGVIIFDCSLIGQFASHTIGKEELQAYQNTENSASLVKTISARNQIFNILQKTSLASPNAAKQQSTVEVCDIKWVDNADHPWLILLVKMFENTGIVSISADLSRLVATVIDKEEAIKFFGRRRLSLIGKRNGKKRRAIRHFALQELQDKGHIAPSADPSDGKTTTNLPGNSEGTHHHILSMNSSIESLGTIQDSSIVVPEVLSIIRHHGTVGTMTVDSLRMICQHAIRRGRHAEDMRRHVQEITSFLVKLGTFQLLCRHLSSDPSLDDFLERFQNVSLADIAQSFAARADLSALTIIVYRHLFNLDEYLEVLNKIPLSTDPASFAHLFPIFRKGSIARSFFFGNGEDRIVTENWSQMPAYVRRTFGIQLVLDDEDGENVLEVFPNQDVRAASTAKFWLWLSVRSALMQSFVGNAKHAILLLKLGMHSEIREVDNNFEEVAEILQLYRHYSTLMSFMVEAGEFMVDDEGILNESGSDSSISMNEQEIVHATLSKWNRPAMIVDICLRFLRPFALGMVQGGIKIFDLDQAISSFCIGLVERCCADPLRGRDTEVWFQSYICSISICVGIAKESRTSKPREWRIIRQKMELLRMVKSILLVSAFTLNDLSISLASCKIFLNSCWQLVETLPAPLPASFQATMTHDYYADVLLCTNALLGFEILCQWPGCTPFSFLAQFCSLGHVANRKIEEFGMPFMIQMVHSFCAQVKERLPRESRFALMNDLLEDVATVNIFCFQGSLEVPLFLTNHLVPLLLDMEAFDEVMALLERHSKFVKFAGVELQLLKLIEDATLVEGEASSQKTSWFRDHSKEIKRIFPDVDHVLGPLERCLEASQFINAFIFRGSVDIEPMAPITLKHVLPLDLIDCILEVAPRSVVYACPQWQQDRNQNTMTNGEVLGIDRVGDAILYLAAILGCTDDSSEATVKWKIVEVSINEGFHEAAIMLCQSMIQDWIKSGSNNFSAAAGIGIAIHRVSIDESSINTLAMRGLYQNFLREIYCSTRRTFPRFAFDILTNSASLDVQLDCLFSDQHQQRMSSRTHESLLTPSLLLDRSHVFENQSRLRMLLVDFHRLVSAGKMQDSATSNLCMESIDAHRETRLRPLERHFPDHLVFFSCSLALHSSGSASLINLLQSFSIAEDPEGSNHTFSKVLRMVGFFDDSGAAVQEFIKLLRFQNPQPQTFQKLQSQPRNPMSKDALGDKNKGVQSSCYINSASGQQRESSHTKFPGQHIYPTSNHAEDASALLSERAISQRLPLGVISTGRGASATRRQQPPDRFSGSTRGRLIEEGRLLLQKTIRKKRSSDGSPTRSQ